MARRKDQVDALGAIFKRTEPPEEDARPAAAQPTPAAPRQAAATRPARAKGDKIVSVGVGLKESERAALDDLAAELGVTRNAVMAWALRYFLAEHRAGRVDVPVERTTSARLQG